MVDGAGDTTRRNFAYQHAYVTTASCSIQTRRSTMSRDLTSELGRNIPLFEMLQTLRQELKASI